jgi:hypothetical protein
MKDITYIATPLPPVHHPLLLQVLEAAYGANATMGSVLDAAEQVAEKLPVDTVALFIGALALAMRSPAVDGTKPYFTLPLPAGWTCPCKVPA